MKYILKVPKVDDSIFKQGFVISQPKSHKIDLVKIPKIMSKMDILTLPYTKIIKSAGEVDDISKYTSPLKLFDYLSVGKMIITSDLEVLKEIINSKNAFFVKRSKILKSPKKHFPHIPKSKNRIFQLYRIFNKHG